MANYIIRRIFVGLLTLLLTIIGISLLIHIVPGDPIDTFMGNEGGLESPEQIARIRRLLGLDLPLWMQPIVYLKNILAGDLGQSIFMVTPVAELLLSRLPATLSLAVLSLFVAIIIGLPFGFFAAYNRGTWIDNILMLVAVIGIAMPTFWMGLYFLLFFSLILDWLPVASGDYRSIFLPALTLGLTFSSVLARMTRSAMIEVFTEDFIRTARAKGLPESIVLYRHALKPAMISIVTIIAVTFGYLMGGVVIVENVFAWNGIGRLALEAIILRDYPIIQGFVLIFASIIILISILIDISYAWLDPRITYK